MNHTILRALSLFCILFFYATSSCAQRKTIHNKIKSEGLRLYESHKYAYAEHCFVSWMQKNPLVTDTLLLKLLADCEWKLRKYGDAYSTYWRLYKIEGFNFTSEMKRRFSDLNAMDNRYNDAISLLAGDTLWAKKQQGFSLIDRYVFDSLNWKISYPLFNTTAAEFLPYYYPGQDLLFVCTDYRSKGRNCMVNPLTGSAFSGIRYFHTIADLPLSNVKYKYKKGYIDNFLSTLNHAGKMRGFSAVHELADAPAIGNRLVFLDKFNYKIDRHLVPLKFNFRNYYNRGCISVEMQKDTATRIPVYFIANINRGRSKRKIRISGDTLISLALYKGNLYNVNENLEVKDIQRMTIKDFKGQLLHTTVSGDGKVMVFSARAEGMNDYDLYYAIRDSDLTWNRVHVLGKNINTSGNEVFPQLQNDGSLYFSSDGLPGMGGLDIFRIKGFYKLNKLYVENDPEHLDYPVNSAFDDYGLTVVNQKKEKILTKEIEVGNGFFTSNRGGSDDILHYRFRDAYLVACGFIGGKNDSGAVTPIGGAKVMIETEDMDNRVIMDSAKTDRYGNYCFAIKPNRKYHVQVSQNGWIISKAESFMVPVVDDSLVTHYNIDPLLLTKEPGKHFPVTANIDTGKTFVVHHYYDKTTILINELAVFDSAVNYIKSHKGCRVEVISAADCFGSSRYADKLSKRRADAVSILLQERGIAVSVSKGVGQSERVVDCDMALNKEAQLPNRHTKIIVRIK